MVSSIIWLLLTLQWASMHNHKSASYVSIIAGVLKLFVASEFFFWSFALFWAESPSLLGAKPKQLELKQNTMFMLVYTEETLLVPFSLMHSMIFL